jgi:23S rRNA (guanosine2251-2'-O)-methyltransferase
MILYGRNPVREALHGRRAASVGEVWATPASSREQWLEGLPVRRAPAEEIERRCGSPAHQGVCARAGAFPYVSAGELLSGPEPLLVALDQVQDPQNLGSICRTAECAGAAGVVICERRAADVSPAVCKASAGAVEYLRIARVRNMADFLAEAGQAGCWCYGASAARMDSQGRGSDPGGSDPGASQASGGPRSRSRRERTPVPYDAPDYRGTGVVLVVGSEGGGLRPRVADACDELIALPLLGRIASLGVSAAAAAVLYEILQSRGANP